MDLMKGRVANASKSQFLAGKAYVTRFLDENLENKPDSFFSDKILVCIRTDMGNISFLSKFKAIVTEYGGLLSHAAIYSRELGIPCIVGVEMATSKIKNEQELKIDFMTGEITL